MGKPILARGERYLLNTDTLAVSADGKGNPVMIHAGEIVVVTQKEIPDGKSFIEVICKEQALRMFSVDLVERGTLVDGSG